VKDITLILPANLYSDKSNITAQFASLGGDMRLTNYYMGMYRSLTSSRPVRPMLTVASRLASQHLPYLRFPRPPHSRKFLRPHSLCPPSFHRRLQYFWPPSLRSSSYRTHLRMLLGYLSRRHNRG